VLLIYTDGISEAAPSQDAEQFGDNRLITSLQALRGKCACEMLDGIIAEVKRFSRSEQADDMTLIVARCR
jgi:serine phosphatase RsbU (regulator of sigma subunit)